MVKIEGLSDRAIVVIMRHNNNKRETKMIWPVKIILAFSVLSLVLFPSLSVATTIQAVTFEELLQYAEIVFEGQVIAVENVVPPNSHMPRTCVLIEINEVFKGSLSDDTADLCFLGGISGEYTVKVANMQYPKLDEKGIYFVKSLTRQYANPLYGWKQGHFLIETDPYTSRKQVTTADRQPVTGIELEEAPSYGLSSGVAVGVKTTDIMQIGKAWTVEEFKQNLRLMLETME